jgi:membrane fusion protein, hemolysin D
MSRHFRVFLESLRQARASERGAAPKDNSDFLPGVLEVLETPPNPLGQILLWVIVGMLALALLWACLGQIDIVAIAQGRVIPDGRIKVLQASEQGVVRAIHVRDGQKVSLGDPLIELDPTMSEAEVEHAREALANAEIDRARASALLSYAKGETLGFQAPAGLASNIAETQFAVVAARISEHRAERENAVQELARSRRERAMLEAEVSRLDQQMPLVEDQFRSLKSLENKGFASRLRVAEVEQKAIDTRQGVVKARQQLSGLEAAESSAVEKLTSVDSRFRRTVLDEFNEADATARLRREELTIAQERNRRTLLTAPSDGIVQQLQVNTIGAVVRPADSILVVVPEGSTLVVEANILNRDIGFVREGQDVRVKLEAFPFTRYGVVDGKVAVLSRDAVQDEKLGLVFPARIELSRFDVPVGNGRITAISSGMAVSAEIRTGHRRIIEFLLSPLSRSVQEAGRER